MKRFGSCFLSYESSMCAENLQNLFVCFYKSDEVTYENYYFYTSENEFAILAFSAPQVTYVASLRTSLDGFSLNSQQPFQILSWDNKGLLNGLHIMESGIAIPNTSTDSLRDKLENFPKKLNHLHCDDSRIRTSMDVVITCK
ncbi:hypothetical protein Tco_0705255 [Tanacetum coccineum]|uniref:Uncharacterized protein n=1 Tax=Tanacetum coccineum TaxID=301880 RepID=A0ABQ4Y426_9ASTR